MPNFVPDAELGRMNAACAETVCPLTGWMAKLAAVCATAMPPWMPYVPETGIHPLPRAVASARSKSSLNDPALPGTLFFATLYVACAEAV